MPSKPTLLPVIPVLLLALMPVRASSAPPPWAEDLLGLAGTVSVFDTAAVRQALDGDGRSPDLEKLTAAAGFRPWPGARLWLVEQGEDNRFHTARPDPALKPELDRRGLMTDDKADDRRIPELMTALQASASGNRGSLAALPARAGVDAIAILSRGNPLRWQLVLPDFTLTGSLEAGGRGLLPHVWAENLALQWQWPGLRQAALIEIRGVEGFSAFKLAETALGTVCRSLRLLRVQGDVVSFACHNGTSATVPEKISALPLLPQPWADHGLDEKVLMGRQLAARTAIYQWQAPAP